MNGPFRRLAVWRWLAHEMKHTPISLKQFQVYANFATEILTSFSVSGPFALGRGWFLNCH